MKTKIFRIAVPIGLVLIAAFVVFLISGNTKPEYTFGEDTPVRVGTSGTTQAMLDLYTFEEAFQEADLVADVTICGWLGELDKEYFGEKTYFDTAINKVYKDTRGIDYQSFTLLQDGNSKWTYDRYPLFKNGDRLILCLNYIGEGYEDFTNGYENCFDIVGVWPTVLQRVESGSRSYIMKRSPIPNFTDLESYRIEGESVIQKAYSRDPVLKQANIECVYPFEDIEKVIDELTV